MNERTLRIVRWGALLLAVAPTLHVAATSHHETPAAQRFVLGLMLWNLAPLVPPFVWPLARRPLLATAWLVACALVDVYAYWAVVVHPTSSTSALLYLFLPLYELLGVGPMAIGGTWLVLRGLGAVRR